MQDYECPGICVDGVCVDECNVDLDCDDGVSCTVDSCVAGLCENVPGPCANGVCDEVIGCVACVPAPSDMVSWWRGDGNADDLQNGNNGVAVNGVSYVEIGKVKQAFSFDGINDYVLVDDDSSLDVTSVTIDAWIKPDTVEMNQDIAFKHTAYSLAIVQGSVSCGVVTQLDGEFSAAAPIDADVWTHTSCTYDEESGVLTLYINGDLVTVNGGDVQNNPLFISTGDFYIGGFSESLFFDGLIDEVEIFDRALTQPEIESIYNAGAAGKCKVPICGNGVIESGEVCEPEGLGQMCPVCTAECIYDLTCCTGGDCCIGDDCCDGICTIEDCDTVCEFIDQCKIGVCL